MTIEQKIEKLKTEIKVAESSLLKNVTDFDIIEVVQEMGSNALFPDKRPITNNGIGNTSILTSIIPNSFMSKYGHFINIVRKLISQLK